MALTKDQKKAQVQELTKSLKEAKSVVFMHYIGLTVSAVDELRGKMLEKNARMKVIKKTLYAIAAKEAGYPEISEDSLDGPVAVVMSFEDEMSGAKVAYEFGKKNAVVSLIGGVLNGKALSKAEALELAKMLNHSELLAKFAMMLRSPLQSFASMASSPLGSFARGVKQLAEKGVAN